MIRRAHRVGILVKFGASVHALCLLREHRIESPATFPMPLPVTSQEITQAQRRIQPHIFRTPLRESFLLGERIGAHVFLKLENWQPGGSFKLRGALNRMMLMSDVERAEPSRRARGITLRVWRTHREC
jgi:hypothetical protein